MQTLRGMSTITIDSSIRGHHVYRGVWTPVIYQVLICKRERHNIHDLFAVAVHKESTVVGHVPRHISAMCHTFFGKVGVVLRVRLRGIGDILMIYRKVAWKCFVTLFLLEKRLMFKRLGFSNRFIE